MDRHKISSNIDFAVLVGRWMYQNGEATNPPAGFSHIMTGNPSVLSITLPVVFKLKSRNVFY